MTLLLGLIGRTLTHSFSQAYFTEKFQVLQLQCKYTRFELAQIHDVQNLLRNHTPDYDKLIGLNVTIPYKVSIIPFLDGLSEEAAAIGAVNTLVRTPQGWIGYNTDVMGFADTLTLPPSPTRALILGNGGAAKAVAYALKQRFNMPFDLVVRNIPREIAPVFQPAEYIYTFEQIDASILHHHLLIINTTPLGMFPDVESYPPLPYHALTNQHYLYDLVYNPELTRFLALGLAQNAHITNGLAMLYRQAEAAFDIWKQYHQFPSIQD